MAMSNNLGALLLYGPDKGMISFVYHELATKLSASIVTSDLQSLESSSNNFSFFSKKDILKIEPERTPTLTNVIKSILLDLNKVNLPVIICDELAPTIAIRKFFETEKSLISLACYPDDPRAIKLIISNMLKSYNKRISADALDYLSKQLFGDRMLIVNEIEKLITYSHNIEAIDYKLCKALIGDSLQNSADMMCIYHAQKSYENYYTEVTTILDSGISEVWVLRALGRFYGNLLKVKMLIMDGLTIDEAMSNLSPPIFFQYVPMFKAIVSQMHLCDIAELLQKFIELERKFKSGSHALELNSIFIFKEM